MRLFFSPFALLFLTACFTGADAHAQAKPSIAVKEAWGLPSMKGSDTGIAFLTIANQGSTEDALTTLSTPAARRSVVHHQESSGDILRMRAVNAVPLAPGATVSMREQGLHVMLESLTRELKAGDRVPITLHFAKAPPLTVHFKVRPRTTHSQDHSAHEHGADHIGHGVNGKQ